MRYRKTFGASLPGNITRNNSSYWTIYYDFLIFKHGTKPKTDLCLLWITIEGDAQARLDATLKGVTWGHDAKPLYRFSVVFFSFLILLEPNFPLPSSSVLTFYLRYACYRCLIKIFTRFMLYSTFYVWLRCLNSTTYSWINWKFMSVHCTQFIAVRSIICTYLRTYVREHAYMTNVVTCHIARARKDFHTEPGASSRRLSVNGYFSNLRVALPAPPILHKRYRKCARMFV